MSLTHTWNQCWSSFISQLFTLKPLLCIVTVSIDSMEHSFLKERIKVEAVFVLL